MYCPNCGKKINDKAQFCPFCDAQFDTEEYKQNEPVAKSFILKFGRFLLDFDTWIWFIIVGIVFVCGLIAYLSPASSSNIDPTIGLLITIVTCVLILAIVTIVKFVIYLLVDISDSLKLLVEKLEKNSK